MDFGEIARRNWMDCFGDVAGRGIVWIIPKASHGWEGT